MNYACGAQKNNNKGADIHWKPDGIWFYLTVDQTAYIGAKGGINILSPRPMMRAELAYRRFTGLDKSVCGGKKIYIAECDGVKDYPILKSGKDKFFELGSYTNQRRSFIIKIKEDAKIETKLYNICYFAEYADVP